MKLRTWILGFRPFFDLLLILIEKKKGLTATVTSGFSCPFLGCVEKLSVQASGRKNQMISFAFDVVRCFLSRRTREL